MQIFNVSNNDYRVNFPAFKSRIVDVNRNLIVKATKIKKPEKQFVLKNIDKINKLLKEGFNLRQIAEKLDLNLSSLYDFSRDRRIVQGNYFARNMEVIEKYNQGIAVDKIAEEMKLNYHTIFDIVGKNTISQRKANKYKIIRLLLEGANAAEIAEKLGVHKATVKNVSARTGFIQNKLVNRNAKIITELLKRGQNLSKAFKFNSKLLNKKELMILKNEFRDREILELIKQGVQHKKIAEMKNINLSTVRRVSLKTSVIKNMKVEEEAKILEMLKEGFSCDEILQQLNCKIGTIKRLAKKYDLYGRFKETRNQQIIDEYKNVKNLRYLAKKYDISSATVRNILKAAGKI